MSNAYDIVTEFERRVAEFTGAPYAVAVDSCTNALFLCCKYRWVRDVTLPARTYCSVPMAVMHAGGSPYFEEREWTGAYELVPYRIWDAAKRFRWGMFPELAVSTGNTDVCLSFHARKHLNIGRGGMILTDDVDAADWYRMARRDGRNDSGGADWQATMIGWNCYLTPEQAARGLQLLDVLPDNLPDQVETYPDLSTWSIFPSVQCPLFAPIISAITYPIIA